jgi:OHS family lactose permease-like MFS transporter
LLIKIASGCHINAINVIRITFNKTQSAAIARSFNSDPLEGTEMMTPGKRNYILLSLFDFLYLFAWSSTMAFFVIWTTQHLGISATKTGLLYSVNAFIALLMQPFFGFISDKFGLKKRLIWILVAMLLPVGPFFIYLYAPLLVHSFWLGALLGGIYLGIIFNSGCGVIDSYIDKISRRYQFEYGRCGCGAR